MINDYIQAIQNYLKDHGFEQLAPEAVLFDMDGVLFDSMRLHNESWQATAAAYDLEMLPDEPYTLEGCTSTLMINTLMERTHQRQATAEELETIYTEKRRRFNALPRPQRMPGAAEMLEKVGCNGLQRVVVTGSGQRSLLERLQTAFPNVFRADLIVSSKDYTQGKRRRTLICAALSGLRFARIRPWWWKTRPWASKRPSKRAFLPLLSTRDHCRMKLCGREGRTCSFLLCRLWQRIGRKSARPLRLVRPQNRKYAPGQCLQATASLKARHTLYI